MTSLCWTHGLTSIGFMLICISTYQKKKLICIRIQIFNQQFNILYLFNCVIIIATLCSYPIVY